MRLERGKRRILNKYPVGTTVGTTMRPHLAVKLTDEQILWVRFKTVIATFEVVLLYVFVIQKHDGWTNGRTQPLKDARTHLKF